MPNVQVQPKGVQISAAKLRLKPFAVSFTGVSHRDLRRITKATEQKYTKFTQNAIAVFADERLAALAQSLSKIALLHDLAQHLHNDPAAAFDMLNAVNDLTEETQDFLTAFLAERGFTPISLSEIPAFVRSEGIAQ
jgi:hypothetical protein